MTHHVPSMDHPHEAEQVQSEKNPAEQKTTRNGFAKVHRQLYKILYGIGYEVNSKSTPYVVPGYAVLQISPIRRSKLQSVVRYRA
jgi:hypothetical protein